MKKYEIEKRYEDILKMSCKRCQHYGQPFKTLTWDEVKAYPCGICERNKKGDNYEGEGKYVEKREKDDLEKDEHLTKFEELEKFYQVLQGEVPEKWIKGAPSLVKLSAKKASRIIAYLQDYDLLKYETGGYILKCSRCKNLYDSWNEGETKGKFEAPYCDNCR